jgi:hypothetical protein
MLTTLTFVYVPREDRLLAAINAGRDDAWSCWLTRRVALAVLSRTSEYLAQNSTAAQRAPMGLRGEVVRFEQEAAIAKTVGSMSTTPAQILERGIASAQLAERLTISPQGKDFRLEIRGTAEEGAGATMKAVELQRMLQMLQIEASRAGWLAGPGKAPAGSEEATPLARH